ncbi:MAG: hypothetical protein ACI9ON_000032 [Limisphaerales bacterium]
MNVVEKYLSTYASLEGIEINTERTAPYRWALIIPAYDETPASIQMLIDYCVDHDALLILIVNAPDNADQAARKRTLTLLDFAGCPNTYLIDHVTQPLPQHQGVGLARKIGTDTALFLYNAKQIRSPWFFQSDADVRLPSGYFQQTMPTSGTVIFNHQHVSSDPKLALAARLYDAHMDHYVAGLRSAGSLYAYPTLGSTLSIHAQSYATVRGFPKRNAGEDFHVLNKLAKIAPVTIMADVSVRVEARLSTRVPFGTGPALARIHRELEEGMRPSEFKSYHPNTFVLLTEAMKQLAEYAEKPSSATFSPIISEILSELGWMSVADKLATGFTNLAPRSRGITNWFDALKTLRFIHRAQQIYPDQPLKV